MGYSTVFIADQNLAVQDLVVTQHVVEHLLIEVFRRSLERDLHSAGLLLFQIDVPDAVSAESNDCTR